MDILVFKVECCFTLTYCDSPCDFDDVVVECLTDIVEIRKDESFTHVEAYSNDILCVFCGEVFYLIYCEVRSEEKFLVVGKLDNEGDVKDIL